MKKFLFSLLTLVVIAFSGSVLNAQINNNEFKVNLNPADLGMCGGS